MATPGEKASDKTVLKITKSVVEGLKADGKWRWDTVVQGFGVRRQVKGAFYYLRFRLNGRQHIKSIGRHGSPWTPDMARTKAKEALGEVAKGRDPFAERGRVAESFGAEVPRFLERKRTALKPRTFVEVERHLTIHAAPLHRLRLAEIEKRTIAAHLAEIEKASGPIARNRVRSSLSAFFAWAISEGFLEHNPVQGTGKATEGSRDRVLSDAELAALWGALPEGDYGDVLRLLILTGQRREEIGALHWSEVDLAKGVIVLGPERTKNRKTHEIPLSRFAQAILERQPSSLLYSARATDGVRERERFVWSRGGFTAWAKSKAALDERLVAERREAKAALMPPWRVHDLRRTCATGMAELGVPPHIIEAVLNHVSGHKGGVAGIYNRARYADEMRAALEKWAAHIDKLVRIPPASGNPAPTEGVARAAAVA